METIQRYLFDGVERASFLWENPNHAAAVVSCIIPLLWAADRFGSLVAGFSWVRYFAWVAEPLLFLMLVLTYSRSGILAWLAAAICFHFLSAKDLGSSYRHWRFWLWRAVLALALIGGFGLSQRLASVTSGDPSAMNRVELWLGGLQLIAVHPLTGWGKGEAGLAFMHWVQNPASDTVYRGMVNSYLNFATEFGLGALFFCLFLILLPLFATYASLAVQPPSRRFLITGCCSGLAAFAIAGAFNTLWIHWSVLWAPAMLVFAIAVLILRARASLISSIIRAAGASFLLCTVLLAASISRSSSAVWQISKLPDGGIVFANSNKPESAQFLTFFPDGRTLGKHYGKAIRGAIEPIADRISGFVIYPPSTRPDSPPRGCAHVFGARASSGDVDLQHADVFLVLPAGSPPAASGPVASRKGLVVLPGVDELGQAKRWESWAASSHIKTTVLPGVGQDVRSRYDMLLAASLGSLEK